MVEQSLESKFLNMEQERSAKIANELLELREKYKELEAELLQQHETIMAAGIIRIDLEEENQKLRDALKFYANESNWLDILDDVPAVFDDRGKIATKALEDE